MKIISVYGSAKVRPGDADYELAVAVGQKLAEAGYTVMTGGYYGAMEAISKGAHSTGGHVIGVITDQIGKRYNLEPNAYVKEVINYAELRDRLQYMVHKADGYVAMPGGVGTLHEIAETWELMRIGGTKTRPFVCYGPLWETVIHALQGSPYLGEGYEGMINIAHSPDEVIEGLQL
jgi:uncharacterized protein (TIGR00730 family)